MVIVGGGLNALPDGRKCQIQCDIIAPVEYRRWQETQRLRQMPTKAREDSDGAFQCLSAGDLNAVGVRGQEEIHLDDKMSSLSVRLAFCWWPDEG